jgi:hypothetical protein
MHAENLSKQDRLQAQGGFSHVICGVQNIWKRRLKHVRYPDLYEFGLWTVSGLSCTTKLN